jgi:hypothetical protein
LYNFLSQGERNLLKAAYISGVIPITPIVDSELEVRRGLVFLLQSVMIAEAWLR